MVAYSQKAVDKMRQFPTHGRITANDLTQAKYQLVQQAQMQYLQEEYQLLREKKPLPETSKLLNLTPFFESVDVSRKVVAVSTGRFPC